jgi:hypothetical protein
MLSPIGRGTFSREIKLSAVKQVQQPGDVGSHRQQMGRQRA